MSAGHGARAATTWAEGVVAEEARYLPAQAAIGNFVHHNTLHALQHLPWARARREAERVWGATTLLSEEDLGARRAAGRFTDADVHEALDELPGGDVELAPGLTATTLRRAMLARPTPRSTDAQAAFALGEEEAAWRLDPRLTSRERDALARETAAAMSRSGAAATWWVDAEVGPATPRVRGRGTHAAPEAIAAAALFAAARAACAEVAEPPSSAAPPARPRDPVLEVTGEDTDVVVHDVLVPAAAAFLDLGVAGTAMPGRERGFLAAFSELHARRGGLAQRACRAARGASADEIVQRVAGELASGEEARRELVRATLLALPGWAGMFHRLERHKGDVPSAVSAPCPRLLDFVAVRLLLDAEAARDALVRHDVDATPGDLLTRARRASARRGRSIDARALDLARVLSLAGVSGPALRALTPGARRALVSEVERFDERARCEVLSRALELAVHGDIAGAIAENARHARAAPARPDLQLVCCIDDREESLRRHAEELDPTIETFGVNGNFGFALAYVGPGHDEPDPRGPVGVDPGHVVAEHHVEDGRDAHLARRRLGATVRRLWLLAHRGVLDGAAASLVLSPLTALALVARVLWPRVTRRAAERALGVAPTRIAAYSEAEHDGRGRRAGFGAVEAALRVKGTLRAIGAAHRLGRLVVVLGHGASSSNNPHASAYDCGACGGRHGSANARAFAALANRAEVRAALVEEGIEIPADTHFLAGFHDTTSDAVTLFDLADVPAHLRAELRRAQQTLHAATAASARERCRRLGTAPRAREGARALAHARARAASIAEPRPELGHATNAAAVVGRRALTRGLYLDRRVFLVSYDPTADDDRAMLERQLMAAGPVGAGINLEYYFSTVDGGRFGSGTKLPHNPTGLVGVMEGSTGDLRTGLPRQMVELHEPVRLLVLVDASPEDVAGVAARQPELRELVENEWIAVACLDPTTQQLTRFDARAGGFVPWSPRRRAVPTAESSVAYHADRDDFLAPARIRGEHDGSVRA